MVIILKNIIVIGIILLSLIIQIENVEGLKNSEELIRNNNVDKSWLAYDLSGSLGIPGDFKDKIYEDACKKIIRLSKKYKKNCGTQIANISGI